MKSHHEEIERWRAALRCATKEGIAAREAQHNALQAAIQARDELRVMRMDMAILRAERNELRAMVEAAHHILSPNTQGQPRPSNSGNLST